MPVAAAIIPAVVGAGASIIGASKNSSAINQASEAQAQTSREQIALQREIYGKNEGYLSPYVSRGNAAGDTINALLGLGAASPSASTATGALSGFTLPAGYADTYRGTTGPLGRNDLLTVQEAQNNGVNAPAGVNWGNYINSQPDVAYDYSLHSEMSPDQYGAWHWERDGARRDLAPFTATTQPAGTAAGSTPAKTAQQAATDAYNIFKQSTGYQNRLAEGFNAINSGYAANGTLQSGAAQKALLKYGQNFASNEYGNYLGYLGNQQGVGLSGASALAGVGQGFANSMGQISQNNANAAATAAGLKANNSNALWANLGGAATNAFGALSSYGSSGMFNPATVNAGVQSTLSQIPIMRPFS